MSSAALDTRFLYSKDRRFGSGLDFAERTFSINNTGQSEELSEELDSRAEELDRGRAGLGRARKSWTVELFERVSTKPPL